MVISQGLIKIHWWEYQIGGLQESREVHVIGLRCCLMAILASSFVNASQGFM